MKTTQAKFWCALVAIAAMTACGNTYESAPETCPDGEQADVGGLGLCVYDGPIIETRFTCPPSHPDRHDYEGLVVCVEEGGVPEDFEDELVERGVLDPSNLRERNNDENNENNDLPPPIERGLRVLLLLDQSASLQCTDQENRRFVAVEDLVTKTLEDNGGHVGVVGFSSWSRPYPFTADPGQLDEALSPFSGLGPATDYEGALTIARGLLADDIAENPDPTRYVVVMLTDGNPEPRCNAGCEDTTTACSDGLDNDNDGLEDAEDDDCNDIEDNSLHPDNLYGVCNYLGGADNPTLEEIRQEQGENLYAAMGADPQCPEYNSESRILGLTTELVDLAAGSDHLVEVHTRLIFAPTEEIEAVCPGASTAFGYDREAAEALLSAIAAQGGGSSSSADVTTTTTFLADIEP